MSEYIIDWDEDLVIDTFSKNSLRESVVRCRDCRDYTDDEMEYYHYCGSWCEQVEPNGYCAWGEKK